MALKVLLVGLGNVGATVLELLAREQGIAHIVACGRDATRGAARCNLARVGAVAQGYEPSIRFVPLDLRNHEGIIQVVRQETPDVIFSSASMQTWWLADLLPPEAAAKLKKARFGIWLPIHLALTLRLMQALRDAGYAGITLTAPYPDVVNCILGKLGLAPTCGVGNLDEIVAKVRVLAAERLHVSLDNIRIRLVAHHALEPLVWAEPGDELPPYYLRVDCNGADVTQGVEADKLLGAPYALPSGPSICFLTAGSTVRMIRGLSGDAETLMHAPGPLGLPGGYPVLVRRGRISLAPLEGLTTQQAISINERSHAWDGIERVEEDGTVVFCVPDVEALRKILGYDCPRLAPSEAEQRGEELVARFGEYAARHGVDLCRHLRGAAGGIPFWEQTKCGD